MMESEVMSYASILELVSGSETEDSDAVQHGEKQMQAISVPGRLYQPLRVVSTSNLPSNAIRPCGVAGGPGRTLVLGVPPPGYQQNQQDKEKAFAFGEPANEMSKRLLYFAKLGYTALHLAAQNGHASVVEVLLKSGVNRNVTNKMEKTPLHLAATEGHANICEILIKQGALVNLKDMLQMTPLHWAVDRNHYEVAELLLRYGATIQCSKFGKTPLDIAADLGNPAMLAMLETGAKAAPDPELESEREQAAAIKSISSLVPSLLDQEIITVNKSGTKQATYQKVQDSSRGKKEILSLISEMKTSSTSSDASASSESLESDCSQQPMCSQSSDDEGLKILEAHGITLLPHDDSNIISTALQAGQTIALSEAGKLALSFLNSEEHKPKEPVEKVKSQVIKAPIAKKAGSHIILNTNSIKAMQVGAVQKPIVLSKQQLAKLSSLKKVRVVCVKPKQSLQIIKLQENPPSQIMNVISSRESKDPLASIKATLKPGLSCFL
ncbi:unnamed protein product [Darwinula stevensoni]|uniref:Uncharacterized protein n=1 Tax=Darwinula stevensoni TaxID=69355 RepID=A0A7R8XJ13_9CRUS|nr:unnamed protein product [Darwinula stevensoni]CAG0894858.1 unnamed protein product [Darwinula stevensoni]